MKNLWNIKDSTGRQINDEPLEGTKEQAETYLGIYYDNPDLEIVEAETIKLDTFTGMTESIQ